MNTFKKKSLLFAIAMAVAFGASAQVARRDLPNSAPSSNGCTVEVAEDGSIELSEEATIDFSPNMGTTAAGPHAGYVRVRLGGKLYVIQLFEVLDNRRQPKEQR